MAELIYAEAAFRLRIPEKRVLTCVDATMKVMAWALSEGKDLDFVFKNLGMLVCRGKRVVLRFFEDLLRDVDKTGILANTFLQVTLVMFSVLPLTPLQPGQSQDLEHVQSPVSVLLVDVEPEALGHSPHGNSSLPEASRGDLRVPTVSIFASGAMEGLRVLPEGKERHGSALGGEPRLSECWQEMAKELGARGVHADCTGGTQSHTRGSGDHKKAHPGAWACSERLAKGLGYPPR